MQPRKRVKCNGDVARDSLGQWVIEDGSWKQMESSNELVLAEDKT